MCIRDRRDGQRLICKVMRTKKDGSSLELSLKSVSEERRRDRLQEWKNEQRSLQLLKVCGEKVGWSEAERDSLGEDLVSSFGTLYTAFEEAAMNETAIIDAGFEGDWITEFIEIAIENIIPPFVEIKGSLNLSINVDNGVDVIRDALISAEQYSSEKDEVSVMCFYDGAPEYRLVLKAPDFKTAEDLWVEVTDSIIKVMEENGGQAATFRD